MPIRQEPEPPRKVGLLRFVETAQSKRRRAAWMGAGTASFKGICPCTFWKKDKGFKRRLWQLADYMCRVRRMEPIKESSLNDNLKDI